MASSDHEGSQLHLSLRLAATQNEDELRVLYRSRGSDGVDPAGMGRRELVEWFSSQRCDAEFQKRVGEAQVTVAELASKDSKAAKAAKPRSQKTAIAGSCQAWKDSRRQCREGALAVEGVFIWTEEEEARAELDEDNPLAGELVFLTGKNEIGIKKLANTVGLSVDRLIHINNGVFKGKLTSQHKFKADTTIWLESDDEGSASEDEERTGDSEDEELVQGRGAEERLRAELTRLRQENDQLRRRRPAPVEAGRYGSLPPPPSDRTVTGKKMSAKKTAEMAKRETAVKRTSSMLGTDLRGPSGEINPMSLFFGSNMNVNTRLRIMHGEKRFAVRKYPNLSALTNMMNNLIDENDDIENDEARELRVENNKRPAAMNAEIESEGLSPEAVARLTQRVQSRLMYPNATDPFMSTFKEEMKVEVKKQEKKERKDTKAAGEGAGGAASGDGKLRAEIAELRSELRAIKRGRADEEGAGRGGFKRFAQERNRRPRQDEFAGRPFAPIADHKCYECGEKGHIASQCPSK